MKSQTEAERSLALPANPRSVLPRHESLDVEFKSDLKPLSSSELIDTIVGLANTEGGTLYLGVEDDGVPTGAHRTHSDATRMAALVANRTIPSIPVRVSTLQFVAEAQPDVTVVRIEIPKSTTLVASSDGRVMRRRLKADGSPESVPMYPYEMVSRLSSVRQYDFSAQPLPDCSIDDLDPHEIERLRRLLRSNRSADAPLLDLADVDLLASLRLLAPTESTQVPTVTGLLLLGFPEAIERSIPTARATFQVLKGTEVRVNHDFSGPLLATIEQIDNLFTPWNPEREYDAGMVRVALPEFDPQAFREALVNAFGHRDYATLGRVRVLVSDEGLSVSSPGGFIEGVTLTNLLTVEPRGRNMCLMDALKRIGLAERTGRGIDRIFEGLLSYGRSAPDYSSSTNTNVTVFMPRERPDVPFVGLLDSYRRHTGSNLSIRSLITLAAIRREPGISIRGIRERTGFKDSEATTAVATLAEGNLIAAQPLPLEEGYRTIFDAPADASSVNAETARTTRNAIEHEILEIARNQGGTLKTRDAAERLGLPRKQAYRAIRKLVDSGKLTPIGNGRAARYEVSKL